MPCLEQQVLEVKILHIYDIQEPRNTLSMKYTHYLDSKWRKNWQKVNLHSMRDISVRVIYFCSHIWVFRISVGTLSGIWAQCLEAIAKLQLSYKIRNRSSRNLKLSSLWHPGAQEHSEHQIYSLFGLQVKRKLPEVQSSFNERHISWSYLLLFPYLGVPNISRYSTYLIYWMLQI